MIVPAGENAFGRAVAQLRRAKGWTQKEVAGRVSSYYGDETAYRRIENGRRFPDRNAAIAILASGLLLRDLDEINSLLALLNFNALEAEEIERNHLEQPKLEKTENDRSGPENQRTEQAWLKLLRFRPSAMIAVLIGSLAASLLVSLFTPYGDGWFPVLTAAVYALLYVVSLLLESTYEPRRGHLRPAAVFVFCFMLLISVGAFALDAVLVKANRSAGLLISALILLAAAFLQWLFGRSVLPDRAIVQTRFQSLPAQAAHLKNTGYFLLIVFFFWLPPAHCVSILEREAENGHVQLVRELLGHGVFVSHGIVCLGVGWLWAILVAMLIASIPMGARLLENLKRHPKLNTYTTLFYLRAFLYFALCLICLGRFQYSLGLLT